MERQLQRSTGALLSLSTYLIVAACSASHAPPKVPAKAAPARLVPDRADDLGGDLGGDLGSALGGPRCDGDSPTCGVRLRGAPPPCDNPPCVDGAAPAAQKCDEYGCGADGAAPAAEKCDDYGCTDGATPTKPKPRD